MYQSLSQPTASADLNLLLGFNAAPPHFINLVWPVAKWKLHTRKNGKLLSVHASTNLLNALLKLWLGLKWQLIPPRAVFYTRWGCGVRRGLGGSGGYLSFLNFLNSMGQMFVCVHLELAGNSGLQHNCCNCSNNLKLSGSNFASASTEIKWNTI